MKKVIATIKAYTQNNDHNHSAIELAKFVENKEATEKLESIEADTERKGYIENYLYRQRYEIVKALLIEVKAKYGDETYQQFYHSF